MANSYFRFKQFTIHQDQCAMKVTTDACLFGAWTALQIRDSSVAGPSILDIGTGTGLLSLMTEQMVPDCRIEAIEIEEAAAGQAKKNIQEAGKEKSIRVIREDIREYSQPEKFDFIISNPPFYEKELKGGNALKNLAHHNEGLRLEELLTLAPGQLRPGGKLFLLLPAKREKEFMNLLQDKKLYLVHLCRVRPSEKADWFRLLCTISKEPGNIIRHEELTIRENETTYTPAFIQLLQPYYLYL